MLSALIFQTLRKSTNGLHRRIPNFWTVKKSETPYAPSSKGSGWASGRMHMEQSAVA